MEGCIRNNDGIVCYKRNIEVLRQSIIWADKRSTTQVEQINRLVGNNKIYQITGNPIFTGFMLPSLLWIKENEPDIYKQIYKISSPKDYVALQLTNNLFSEPTDALATGCFDYSRGAWSKELLNIFSLNPSIFPKIIPTTTSYGSVTSQASEKTGLPEGIPVFGGSNQSMATFGCGLIENRSSLLSISTGGQFLVINKSNSLDPKKRVHTLNHAIKGISISMSATLCAGLSLQWFKKNIMQQLDSTYDSFIKDIDDIPIGSEGLIFLPFLTGERTPYFNPHLRSAFIGQSLHHNRLHFIRAIMEGVAFSFREGLETFKQLGIFPKNIILSGGGSKNELWRQIITDVLNIPTLTVNNNNHSSFGAAIFAKFASDNKLTNKSGLEDLAKFYKKTIKISHKLLPSAENHNLYTKIFNTYKKHANYLNSPGELL